MEAAGTAWRGAAASLSAISPMRVSIAEVMASMSLAPWRGTAMSIRRPSAAIWAARSSMASRETVSASMARIAVVSSASFSIRPLVMPRVASVSMRKEIAFNSSAMPSGRHHPRDRPLELAHEGLQRFGRQSLGARLFEAVGEYMDLPIE